MQWFGWQLGEPEDKHEWDSNRLSPAIKKDMSRSRLNLFCFLFLKNKDWNQTTSVYHIYPKGK